MAQAIVSGFQSASASEGNIRILANVIFSGTDISGGSFVESVVVTFADTATVTQMGLALRAAIQALGTSRGFTIPNGNTLLPDYQRL